jgi:L-alanine-DL-glutamate epimerase-like enolase superfamily enzyme
VTCARAPARAPARPFADQQRHLHIAPLAGIDMLAWDALAKAQGLPLSSHLLPEVSAHPLAVTTSAHWLENVDWADPVLQEPLRVEAGHVTPPDVPRVGFAWDEEGVRRCLVP